MKTARTLSLTLSCLLLLFVSYNFYISSHTIMVAGASMSPTLQDKQIVKIDSGFSNISDGDIVIIRRDEENYVKRVIAGPGEIIDIQWNRVYVNGKYTEDMNGISPDITDARKDYPIRLGEDEYFVMGDNRNASWDSRSESFGNIKKAEIFAIVMLPDDTPKNRKENLS